MDYLKNHCRCSSSHWDGLHYACNVIVSLNCYEEGYKEDWANLTEKVEGTDRPFTTLKPEVLQWLNDNVADTKTGKGWCIGSEEYLKTDSSSFQVFFQYRRDAMKFIKVWSKWKKPINYCQYFTDIRKRLDLTTGKYL